MSSVMEPDSEYIEYSVNAAGQDIYRRVIVTEWAVVDQP